MNYIYVDNEYIPVNCATCRFYNKYKYCNILNIKIANPDKNNRYKECPLRSVNLLEEFYKNLIKANLVSSMNLLNTFNLMSTSAEEYIRFAYDNLFNLNLNENLNQIKNSLN